MNDSESYDLDGATTQESTSQPQAQSQKLTSTVGAASFISRNSGAVGSTASVNRKICLN